MQGICVKKPTYIRFLSIAVVIETVLVVEEEEVKELLVEVEEVLEKDELVEAEEKNDAPCMFLRYLYPHAPSMLVTTSDPSIVP